MEVKEICFRSYRAGKPPPGNKKTPSSIRRERRCLWGNRANRPLSSPHLCCCTVRRRPPASLNLLAHATITSLFHVNASAGHLADGGVTLTSPRESCDALSHLLTEGVAVTVTRANYGCECRRADEVTPRAWNSN